MNEEIVNDLQVEERAVAEMQERENDVVEWQAQEYVTQQRNMGWYLGLLLVGAVLTGAGVWLKYWSFAVLVVVSVLALVVYVKRPARMLQYKLTKDGLYEGEKLYRYSDFKAFAVLQDGQNFSIAMMPKKRLGMLVRVYFPQDQGEQIVDMFGMRMPMEELKMDILDKIVKFLRI